MNPLKPKTNLNTYKLGEITEWKSGGTPPKLEKRLWNGDVPWISAKTLTSSRISTSNTFLTNEGLERGSRLAKEGSILLLVRGSGLFKDIPVAIVEKPVAFNQDVKSIEVNREVLDPWYFLYWLIGNKKLLYTKLEATGIGAGKFDINILKELEINLPSLRLQQRIASIAKCWDDKIALNHSMNQTLEQMAQTLFRQSFVKGIDEDNLPEGWGLVSINEIAEVIFGAAFSSKLFNEKKEGLPLIRIRDLKDFQPQFYTTESHKKATIINKGDILVGMDAEFSPCIWQGEKAYLNQRVCFFKPSKNLIHSYFIFEAIKPHLKFFEAAKVGTTVIHLGKSDIDSFKVIIPTDDELKVFNRLIDPIFKKIIHLSSEVKSLTNLRDSLLPKLMSGEIDVMNTQTDPLHEPVLS